ncbi:MAG: endo alpha-1,4 polygalactosaminidase [Candidatus Limnocylindrales bacterium]
MSRLRVVRRAIVTAACVAWLVPGAAPALATAPTVVPCPGCWHPGPGTTWQYQLSGIIDTSIGADAFSIDLVEVPRAVIRDLHDQGKVAVCYISAGSWEEWRPDADAYPEAVLGDPLDGWPGERWLDIRALSALRPILRARLDRCADKGFDGVDFDNVDGYANRTGFPVTPADQLRFNRWLTRAAHLRGLSAGLKNDLAQAAGLEPDFEFAINEQCFSYHECFLLRPFIDAGKSVMVVEYDVSRAVFCDRAADLGAFAMRKRLPLGAWRRTC